MQRVEYVIYKTEGRDVGAFNFVLRIPTGYGELRGYGGLQ